MRDIFQIIKALDLNLNGLNILTEAASNEYQLMPILAAMAGGNVFALGKDTSYGKFKDIKKQIENKAINFGISKNLKVLHIDEFEDWGMVDIVTNSGMLRPITREKISRFKKTSVIPLLWETWEFRSKEIDLIACRDYGIPIIGTNENFSPINMFMYPSMLAIYLFNKANIDYSTDEIILFGGGLTGTLIAKHLMELNDSIYWFCDSYRDDLISKIPFSTNQTYKILEKKNLKAILIAEHSNPTEIIGENGLINSNELFNKFPDLKIIHLCGNINKDYLNMINVKTIPDKVADFGYMSILPNVFGNVPMLKLFGGGLKVGEIAARSRIKGESPESAIKRTIEHGIGQDFKGGFFNYRIE